MPCASGNRQEINSWVQVADALKEKECGSVDGRGWSRQEIAILEFVRHGVTGKLIRRFSITRVAEQLASQR